MKLTDSEIQQRVNKFRDEIYKANEKHKLKIESIYQKLDKIRELCKHSKTTYWPDPSGNNDYSYTCDICGKKDRRL